MCSKWSILHFKLYHVIAQTLAKPLDFLVLPNVFVLEIRAEKIGKYQPSKMN
jgi:hypothetical protein